MQEALEVHKQLVDLCHGLRGMNQRSLSMSGSLYDIMQVRDIVHDILMGLKNRYPLLGVLGL